jgi:hypothetical protein
VVYIAAAYWRCVKISNILPLPGTVPVPVY